MSTHENKLSMLRLSEHSEFSTPTKKAAHAERLANDFAYFLGFLLSPTRHVDIRPRPWHI